MWIELITLNTENLFRIHDGNLPTNSEGRSFAILSLSLFTSQRADVLKKIAVTADLMFGVDDLVIKGEAEFSGSSNS